MFDAAQAIGAAHRTAGDDPGASPQPLARRTYPLRSRVRCRICQRRMCGTTRTSPRYWAEGPDYANTYYKCSHNANNPRHAAAHPDHPRTVTIREDTLMTVIRDGLAARVFGPDRRTLLAQQIPATAAGAAEQHQREHDHLTAQLARIDLAQRSQITQIDTLDPDPASTAAQAMRARCYERFAELQHQRETAQAALDAHAQHAPRDDDTSLLDLIPLLASTIELHPEHIQAKLYQAFDIEALYNNDMHQVTIFATITASTPGTITQLLADTGSNPAPANAPEPETPAQASPPADKATTIYPLTDRPICARVTLIMARRVARGGRGARRRRRRAGGRRAG
jgi:hypothetical protein